MKEQDSARLPGFYELPLGERAKLTAQLSDLSQQESLQLQQFGSLSPDLVDIFIENGIGTFALPMGLATNFLINGRDVLVPMAVEESSVLAAASHGAKLARAGGGFKVKSTPPIMNGQVQITFTGQVNYEPILKRAKPALLRHINEGHQRLVERGGGAEDLTWYFIEPLNSLVLLLHVHTCDAMGANIVNSMAEKLAVFIPELFPEAEIGLRILTNLTTKRMARAECMIPASAFTRGALDGHYVVEKIEKAYQFACHDVMRATTHNKGVMNGIDPVLIATGNDWRAIEAGAHAYACKNGVYGPLTHWRITAQGDLYGCLELPMAVGTVGGVTKLHPTAQAALKILGNPTARELAEITTAVGLAQNLSALRALATEGIQQGHMSLHQKNIDLLARPQVVNQRS